jgi:site-specific DNA recombinase
MFRDLGYARISKDDERTGRGVGRQTDDVRRHSEATGGQLVEMFTENDVSASRYARTARREYPRLIEAARAGIGDRILVYRMDRLLRIPTELEALIALCEQRRLPVVNLHGSMDLATAEGRKAARDRVADAAFESDLISERTRRTFDETAAEGRAHGATGGSRSFGYEPDGVTIRDVEAEVIRAAAAEVLFAGVALNEIARRWNAAGFRGPRSGKPWSNRTVRSVLIGHRAAGLRVHRGGTDDERVYRAQWPAILDEATHRALRRRFVDGSARRPGRRTEYTGLLFGVVDGKARPMRRDRSYNQGGCYVTYAAFVGERFRRVGVGPIDEVERTIRGWLFARVESGRLAESIEARRLAAPSASESPAEVQALIDQADEDEADGVLDRRGWLTKRPRLEARLARAEAAEAAIRPRVVIPTDVRAQWDGWDIDRRAVTLREVLDRVEVVPAERKGPGLDESRLTPVWR